MKYPDDYTAHPSLVISINLFKVGMMMNIQNTLTFRKQYFITLSIQTEDFIQFKQTFRAMLRRSYFRIDHDIVFLLCVIFGTFLMVKVLISIYVKT